MNEKSIILIVDDDRNTRDGLERALKSEYEIMLAESAERALNIMGETHVDILLSDVRMPGMDGLTLMQRALAKTDPPICILLTAYGNVETAVEAMKRGAYDFLTKPVNLDRLELLLTRALHARDVVYENINLHEQLNKRYGIENIISHSAAMVEIFEIIKQSAPTQATVLIQGRSGTGKELVAHAIHRLSSRANGPFIAIHCAALSSNLLESELFGHEKGAFTGATERRRGRFEMADGGTLFLDEVSEIDHAVQIKLLRVLEESQFERVGGSETLDVDIRLIAATNHDLRERVEQGKFREDLFYRLDVVNINLPLLSERIGDVPLLCKHFLTEFNEKNQKNVTNITPETINILSSYTWPGNVRELRNTIEKMVVLSRSNKLTPRDIPPNIRQNVHGEAAKGNWGGHIPITQSTESLNESEKLMIYAALKKNNGNKTKAAEQLGISRRTLHRKLNQYEKEDRSQGSGVRDQ